VTLRTTRRLVASIAVLLGIQLLTAFGAIVLLARMSPAIEKILRENVASVAAAEEMALALAGAQTDPSASKRYFEALGRARGNITVPEERPAIETLERVGGAALRGEAGPRGEAIAALGTLGAVNREAMQESDAAAGRLGSAGAWAAVFLGLVGLLASGITVRRLEARVLSPLAEITRVVVAQRAGDRRRRCATATASGELQLVMSTLNELFDLRERSSQAPRPDRRAADDRAIVDLLLDQRPEPVLVIGRAGDVLRANRQALDLLASDSGPRLREALGRAVHGEGSAELGDIRQVGDSEQWLCVLSSLPKGGEKEYAASP
jgi:PAS domain-containing protein